MAEIRNFADMDPTDALVIMAFPSTGAASPIAAAYLIQHLNMPLVGDIADDGFDGVVHIENGVPTSPVRIHGGDVACELDGPCLRTYVITTEIPLPLEQTLGIANAVMKWASKARLVLGLDAVVRELDDDTPDVYSVANGETATRRMSASKAPPLSRAIISGMTAAILADSVVPVGAFVVEARKDHPDGRAAAALVTALDPLVPQIAIDAEPLMKDAMELEKSIRQAMAEAGELAPRKASHTFI